MADTHTGAATLRPAQGAAVPLEDAIAQLEAGAGHGITVDLGGGRIARAEGVRGEDGLLQRLRGHRMILALAAGQSDLTRFASDTRPLVIAPEVQDILDAIISRG